MSRFTPIAVGLVALALLVVVGPTRSAVAGANYEPFPEFENVKEIPVVGKLPPRSSRLGPPATKPQIRLAVHYLRIIGSASEVRCHGIQGGYIGCRVHIDDWVVARLGIIPIGEYRDIIDRCETLRVIHGPLTDGACFDFTIWEFDQWQEGPPRTPEG